TRGLIDMLPKGPAPGSFDWMVGLYRASPQYQGLSARMKANFEYGLGIASRHPLKNDQRGRTRFGQLALQEITPGVVDSLYSKVKVQNESVLDATGQSVMRTVPRLRRAQEVIKGCRRAWNVARRNEPTMVPSLNPFENAEVEAPKAGKTIPATWEQTLTFVVTCDRMGDWSIGTAALVAFCWFQREEHIMGVPR